MLSVTCYLLLIICDLLFDTFHLQLSITFDNSFPFAHCCTSRNFSFSWFSFTYLPNQISLRGCSVFKTSRKNPPFKLYKHKFCRYLDNGDIQQTLREASELKKCHKKWKKPTIFLAPPPSPRIFWTFLNLRKIGKDLYQVFLGLYLCQR